MPCSSKLRDPMWGVVIACLLVTPLPGQPTEPKWELLEGDCQVRVRQHARTTEPPCDVLRFIAGHGTETYAYVKVPHAAVIPELKAEVPLRADRTGLQILARVVLPRAINPATDFPYTLLVAGESYKAKTQWQSLALDNIAQKMERGIRALQLETSHPIDAREAYMDIVLVNIYGGPGNAQVQLGDAVLDGVAESVAPAIGLVTWSGGRTRATRASLPKIHLSGDLLLVKGQPFLARMIDDNGENWKFLSELGVNTIRLNTPASVEQMARAESWGMWIVCPPPDGAISADSAIHWRRVLAWDLSNQIPPADSQHVVPLSQALRQRDGLQLPLLCDSPVQARLLSGAADIMIHYRTTLGTELSLGEYADWVAGRVDHSHPGKVHWMGIDTQPCANLRQQISAFGGPEPDSCELDQLHLLTRLACMRGIRGVYFHSETRLDPDTTQGRKRALAIRQSNADLDVMQPWLSAGQTSPIPAPQTATARVHAWQSVRGGATLVSVVRTTATSQYCPDPAVENVSLVLPGVSDVDHVLLLSTAGMPPLPKKQIAGGVDVSIPLTSNAAWLLVTRDPNIVRELADKLNSATESMTQLATQRIDFELAEEQLHGRQAAGDVTRAATLKTLREDFRRALGQQNYLQCHHVGNELLQRIAQDRFDDWRSMSSQYDSPAACPLATQPCTRRWLEQLQSRTFSSGVMLNLLAAGNCDAIEQFQGTGWQLIMAERRRDLTSASVVTDQKHGGSGCLRLQALADNASSNSDGGPWIWANTPPTTIPAAQIFRLDGWTKYESQDGTAGLLIFDSLAGPGCGLRRAASGDWKPFTLYRATVLDTPITLTFALTGPGRAWIDDVTISLMQPSETLRADVAARQYALERR